MIEKIKREIFISEPFKRLSEHIQSLKKDQPIIVRGVGGSLLAFEVVNVFEERASQVVLLASDKDKAEKLRDDSALLIGDSNVRWFAGGSTHHAQLLDVSASIAQIETLRALASEAAVIVATSPEAIVGKITPPETFKRRVIELEADKEHSFQKFIEQLHLLGFEKKDFVEGYGDFAVRGGILDVFPFVGDNPLRFEFWGDTVESIREFDVLSQRSIKELQAASIVPDLIHGKSEKLSASLFDYLKRDAVVILDDPLLIEREIDELHREGIENIFDWEEIQKRMSDFSFIINSQISHPYQMVSQTERSPILIDFASISQPSFNGSAHALVENLRKLHSDGLKVYITCDTKEEAARIKELIEEIITQPSDISSLKSQHPDHEQFLTNFQSNDSDRSPILNVEFFTETVHSGFIFPSAKLAVFTEHEIFDRLKRRGTTKRHRFKGFSQKEVQQLKPGDYVVHVDYGVGEFAGLEKIKLSVPPHTKDCSGGDGHTVEQEVMKVLYLDNDTLYVNLNYINRVQKYSSREGHIPKLNRLGAPDWERLKSRAKRHIKDIARDLIQLYARRKHEKGFAFSPDTHWQKELEASFMYEDTPDQAQATLDIKRDMESEAPMDRLVCGDVGFGKTEVAVRASFKAVMDGKQVPVLVPTTILAMQHLNTFRDRLSRYAVRVEDITRFKSKKSQQHIVQELEEGKIDIIIGTHRLLSKDIGFKDLGLLIIDEEHRFGVSAKEKLRRLRTTVDTLTLTATPIPRTLQFSLMGARDLSIINTPPRNRLPIVTETAQFDLKLIREAILKELHHGGQVYFVHDRVQKIEEMQLLLQEHIPEARFHIAHGQMTGHELEKTMMDFLEKKYDVLICTKIIESGIDIPNVNTIFINRADRFGMAELYQLRGRVGRSNVQAYAYLLTPPISVLPKATIRRLQAIEEFTELGSGFNLAMRDLEIRGAGNLLGAEQSGFIVEMGFEMYQRILEEVVRELKEQEFNEWFKEKVSSGVRVQVETAVEADLDAYIPDFYIESDAERLDFYRRLYQVESLERVQDMREELKDRFGEYPDQVENLFMLVELKTIASQIGFSKVELRERKLNLSLPDSTHTRFYEGTDERESKFQSLIAKIHRMKNYKPQLKQEGKILKLLILLKSEINRRERLQEAKGLLSHLHSEEV